MTGNEPLRLGAAAAKLLRAAWAAGTKTPSARGGTVCVVPRSKPGLSTPRAFYTEGYGHLRDEANMMLGVVRVLADAERLPRGERRRVLVEKKFALFAAARRRFVDSARNEVRIRFSNRAAARIMASRRGIVCCSAGSKKDRAREWSYLLDLLRAQGRTPKRATSESDLGVWWS